MFTLIQNKLKAVPRRHLRIGKNAALLFGLNGFRKVLGLATTYFLVRALSLESFGEYNFILSVIGFSALSALPGMKNAIVQSVARGKPGAYRAALHISFFSSFLGSLVLVGFGIWYVNHDNNGLAAGFFLASAVFPFAHGLAQWGNLKEGKEDFESIVKIKSLAFFLTSVLIIGGVHWIPGSLLVPLGVIICVQAIQNLILTYTSLQKVGKDQQVEKGIIPYGLKTSLWGGLGLAAKYTDKFLIFSFLSPASLAIYVVAERFPKMFRGLIKNLAAALAPRFAKQRLYTERLDTYLRYFSWGTAIAVVVFSFSLLPWLVVLIFGDSYHQAVPYAQMLMCSLVIGSALPLRIRFIRSKIDDKSFREIVTARAITRIGANLILIPTMGLMGAVISMYLAKIVVIVVVSKIIKKRYSEELATL
jgi:O-antigen/teichoic acid export membrane protein